MFEQVVEPISKLSNRQAERSSVRRFYVEPGEAGKVHPQIKGQDFRHMQKVLRHEPGDRVILIDGSGFEYLSVIEKMDSGTAYLSVLEKRWSDTASPLELVVAQGFLKDKKMDTIIRHLTELGLTRWIPVISQRSVARPDHRRMHERMRRWKTIAVESMKQCGLSRIPLISDAMTFEALLDSGEEYDGKIIFWEEEKVPLKDLFPNKPRKLLVLVGPEGGFSPEEVDHAKAFGFSSASLGPRILRAETASIAACTLLQYLYGDMKKEIHPF